MADFFVSCSKGLEYLLCDELLALGAERATAAQAGANVHGTLELALRAVMHSRLASRVLWPLLRFECETPDELYEGVRTLRWAEHLGKGHTLAVDAHVSGEQLNHSQFAAQRVKDAVVDTLREAHGERPSVDLQAPDLRLGLSVRKGVATLSVDLGGGSLHRRGLRQKQGQAPLKETLAAAMLLRGGFLELHRDGAPLIDPMCGSATILIEAASMAADVAPGVSRHRERPPTRWLGLAQGAWAALHKEAHARAEAGRAALRPSFFGSDIDSMVLRAAELNVQAAGFSRHITLRELDVAQLPRRPEPRGLVVTNPPYAERMAADEGTYRALGRALRRACEGYRAVILCGTPELSRATGLRAQKTYQLFNGALECVLLRCDPVPALDPARTEAATASTPLSDGALMVANRLKKNLRSLSSWAKQHDVRAYRLYDGDLPEYAAAVELYEVGQEPGQVRYVHVQEPRAPKEIPLADVKRRRAELLRAVAATLELPRERIVLSVQGDDVRPAQPVQFVLREAGLKLRIDLSQGGDPGARLDQRLLRARLAEESVGKRYLQLFGGAGAMATRVLAAGASQVTVVDAHDHGLDAVAENCGENALPTRQRELVLHEPLSWLQKSTERFDRIGFEVPLRLHTPRPGQPDFAREYLEWFAQLAAHLHPGGVAYLSTRFTRFRVDEAELQRACHGCEVLEITAETLPRDFARSPRIHRTWRVSR